MRVQTPLDAHVHGFAGGDVVQREKVVIREFCFEARAGRAHGQNAFAHEGEGGLGAGNQGRGAAEHEGEGASCGADDAAGHGGVDEGGGGVGGYGVGYGDAGCWIDC